MNARSRSLLIFFAPLAVALGTMSLAWACNPNPWIDLDPEEGPAGTQVTVTGDLLKESRVELTWGSYDGPVLGEATGPKFSLTITIPQAEEGSYLVLAQAWDADGERMNERANAVYTVETEQAKPPPPSGEQPPPAAEEPKPDKPPVHGDNASENGPVRGRGPRAGNGAPVDPGFSGPSGSVMTSAGAVFEASLPPDPRPRNEGRSAAARLLREPSVPAELDARTAGEMWSGLDEGASAAVTEPVDVAAPATRAPVLIAGVILLALGLVGVFGGFLVTEVRRRRAGSETHDQR